MNIVSRKRPLVLLLAGSLLLLGAPLDAQETGTIPIEITENEGWWKIVVSDQGSGFDPAVLSERIG